MKTKNCIEKGFTLVEMMVVVAIIGILMIVALPAYNNYSTKSKFTEVVLATAPTKTAIATCAGTGDCVSNNAIALTLASSSSSGAVAGLYVPAGTGNDSPTGPNALAIMTAAVQAQNPSWTVAQAQLQAQSNLSFGLYLAGNAGNPANLCFDAGGSNCGGAQITIASFNQFYAPNAALIAAAAAAKASDLPCVGPAATGCSPPTKYAASVSFDGSGDITATAQVTSGLNGETFVLIPQYSGGRVDWSSSGTCKTRAGGAIC